MESMGGGRGGEAAQIKRAVQSGACVVFFGIYVLCFVLGGTVFVFMQLLWLVVIQIQEMVRFMVMFGRGLCFCSKASDELCY